MFGFRKQMFVAWPPPQGENGWKVNEMNLKIL